MGEAALSSNDAYECVSPALPGVQVSAILGSCHIDDILRMRRGCSRAHIRHSACSCAVLVTQRSISPHITDKCLPGQGGRRQAISAALWQLDGGPILGCRCQCRRGRCLGCRSATTLARLGGKARGRSRAPALCCCCCCCCLAAASRAGAAALQHLRCQGQSTAHAVLPAPRGRCGSAEEGDGALGDRIVATQVVGAAAAIGLQCAMPCCRLAT